MPGIHEALNYGAVATLLVTEGHESGKRLKALTGVGALLRFEVEG